MTGPGRLGEVAGGRFGAFSFGEVGFGWTTALEKADRLVWVVDGRWLLEIQRRLTESSGQRAWCDEVFSTNGWFATDTRRSSFEGGWLLPTETVWKRKVGQISGVVSPFHWARKSPMERFWRSYVKDIDAVLSFHTTSTQSGQSPLWTLDDR